jgi:3-keto-5-aminohexanoate cleavage enzyme
MGSEIYQPMIISVVLTGAIPPKAKYPSLPIEPDDIPEQALLCADLGATIVHLHMRDETGNQTQSSDRLSATVKAIRKQNTDLSNLRHDDESRFQVPC